MEELEKKSLMVEFTNTAGETGHDFMGGLDQIARPLNIAGPESSPGFSKAAGKLLTGYKAIRAGFARLENGCDPRVIQKLRGRQLEVIVEYHAGADIDTLLADAKVYRDRHQGHVEAQEAARLAGERQRQAAELEAEAMRMNAAQIIELCRGRGVELKLDDGDQIVAQPRHRIDERARIAINVKRRELLAYLREQASVETV